MVFEYNSKTTVTRSIYVSICSEMEDALNDELEKHALLKGHTHIVHWVDTRAYIGEWEAEYDAEASSWSVHV